jgi:hypothetical protein
MEFGKLIKIPLVIYYDHVENQFNLIYLENS